MRTRSSMEKITLADLGITSPADLIAELEEEATKPHTVCKSCGKVGTVDEVESHDCKYEHGE